MATNATVPRTRRFHPTIATGVVAALCIGIGLTIGLTVGTGLARTATPAVAPAVTSKVLSDVSIAASPTTELQLRSNGAIPSSAPGNPYVNIHMPAGAGAPNVDRPTIELQLRSNGAIPSSAPGNPYVNIHMPTGA